MKLKLKYLILAVLILILLASFAYREMAEGDKVPSKELIERSLKPRPSELDAELNSSYPLNGIIQSGTEMIEGIKKLCGAIPAYCETNEAKLMMATKSIVNPGDNRNCGITMRNACNYVVS